jgi:hypothetical protein
MSGYVPLFDSLTKGTLCGRWPDIGLWPIVLSLSDRQGHVDVTCNYLAGVTGLPVEEVFACMARFCEPDPKSRSKDASGARLVLLDQHRDWGWRVVNHAAYREKARLTAKASREVADGANKARMADRRSPPVTAGDPLSNSNSNSNKNPEEIFQSLLKSSGKEPRRTERIQKAIDKIGGWPKIRNCSEFELPQARRAFCEAYNDH